MPRPITTKIFQFLAPLVYLWHYTLDRCSTTTKKRTDRRRWYNPCAWWWMNDDEWRWMMDGKSSFWTQRRPENQVFGHNGGQQGCLGSPGGTARDPSRFQGVTQRPQLKTWNHPKMAIVARPIIMQTYERSSRDVICSKKKFAFRRAFEGGQDPQVKFYHDKVNEFR